MTTFLDRAKTTIEKGVPVIRLRPKTKIALDTDWPALATTDLSIIKKWNLETPDANCASVAQAVPNGMWFLEIDHPDVQTRLIKETGNAIPSTFAVRSSPGRGHFYFRQNDASIAMGNIAQSFIKNNDWSARVDKQYVVSGKSIHPKTGLEYEIRSDAKIVEAPQWLINWLISQKTTTQTAAISGDKIPYGTHDVSLTRIAGRLRRDGLEEDALAVALIEVCEKRCENYGSDYKEMCQKIAHSIARYEVGQDLTVYVNGVPAGTSRLWTAGNTAVEVLEEPEVLPTEVIPYPIFPGWVLRGTSIYEGLIKPVCDVNCRYEEFMALPAIAMMLNYIGMKVKIEHNTSMIPSLYIVLVGEKGRVLKSSSVEDAVTYFNFAGVSGYSNNQLSNAEGKSLIFQVGSTEGLGVEMTRLNCRNAVLFYDELSTLTKKASIESSTMNSHLLSLYESGIFQNAIKGRKESFSFSPGTYCASLIACATNKGFLPAWSQLASKSTGLEDRFFFLMQPQTLKPVTSRKSVNFADGAAQTRKLIERAIERASLKMDTFTLDQELNKGTITNREAGRMEKFALYFAVDRGMNEIDGDCMERALHLIKYEKAAKNYLQTYEGSTREATLQMEIESKLRKNENRMYWRDLYHAVHGERVGTAVWEKAYQGLIRIGKIREEGTGKKSDPKMVQLLWVSKPDEDD